MADKNGLQSRDRPDFSSPPIGGASIQIPYAPTGESEIVYPESDGTPMGETELHRDAIIDALQRLKEHFKDYPDVCVSGHMMMYFEEGNPRKSISPDVFVTFGVERKQRRTYRIWEEGWPPQFVLEFSSERTYRNDLRDKKALYAEIGIAEYFLCDVEGRYLQKPLMGFRLAGSDYDAIPPYADGSVPSVSLGLELRIREEGLGFYDPVLRRWLETPAEAAAAQAQREVTARRRAESAAEREAEARKKAESTAEREVEARKKAESTAEREAEARKKAETELARLREEIERMKA